MQKGESLEANYSKIYHRDNYPVLVSSLLLRSFNAGQIDLAYLKKIKNNEKALFELHLIEIKTSQFPNEIQRKRLNRAREYLTQVLDIDTFLSVKFCKKSDSSLSF